MTMKAVGLGAATAIGFACLTAGAQAAPLSANSLKAETSTSSAVEKAAYRRCWWRHGVRVCRWVHDDYGYYGYGPSYGYGPGIGFSFGGGGRHFHGHRHHHR
jgi:hypothetical protein